MKLLNREMPRATASCEAHTRLKERIKAMGAAICSAYTRWWLLEVGQMQMQSFTLEKGWEAPDGGPLALKTNKQTNL